MIARFLPALSIAALGIGALWVGAGGFAAGAGAQSQPIASADAAGGAEAAPPELSVVLSPGEIRVGDLIEVVIRLEQEPGAQAPAFPNWQRHWGEAEIREIGEVTRASDGATGRAVYSQTLVLTAFRPGPVALPPQTVTLPGDGALELSTEPASFEVVSVLPPGDEEIELRPPAPPRPLPLGSRFLWTAGVLALLALGLLAVALLRRRSEAAIAGEPVDPWDALESALARLAQAADAETAFTGLSLELRRYLGRTLAFPAAESTTTELRRRLVRSGLPQSVCGEVVRLLLEADTVKFARKNPPPARVRECLDRTRLAAAEIRRFLEPRDVDEPGEEAA